MTDEYDVAAVDATARPSGAGCAECELDDGWWVHLRRCAACGHVGCCDSSLGQHATAHARATGHRYIQSFEPGEDWWWDYDTRSMLEGPVLADPTSHPDDQSAPGPADRVPSDWQQQLQDAGR